METLPHDSDRNAVIRLVQPKDWPVVRDVMVQMLTDAPLAFGETLAEVQARSDAAWQQLAASLAGTATACAFLAEDALGVCGFVGGDAAFAEAPPGTVVAGRLWVAPRQRGKGLGRALMDAVTKWAEARGADQLALGVTEMNTDVLKFYAHLGYADTGLRFPWPVDATKRVIVLARRLKP
jgi:GNAT superfamily N-acetyltransferase